METKCTCERPDDNICDYCEKQQEETILVDAKNKCTDKSNIQEGWNSYYDNIINKYWKTTNSKRLEEIITKLDSLLEIDFQSYYLIHSKFYRLLIKKQQEELNYKFFGYKATIDVNNFVDRVFRKK